MDPTILAGLSGLGGVLGGGGTKVNTSSSSTASLGVSVNPIIQLLAGSKSETPSTSGSSNSSPYTGAPSQSANDSGQGYGGYSSPPILTGASGVSPKGTDFIGENSGLLILVAIGIGAYVLMGN